MKRTLSVSIVALSAVFASHTAKAQVNDNCSSFGACVSATNSSSGLGIQTSNLFAMTTGTQGTAVSGTSNNAFGVYGQTSDSSHAGVFGTSIASSSAIGVKGSVTGSGSIGVEGISDVGNGIVGQNTRTDSGAAAISALAGSSAGLAYWGTGGIQITGSALKPGGGSWTNSSDARIKKDVTDYAEGLAELERVRPVRFRYNGLGGTEDDGKVYVGVIAQELEKVFPDMVSSMKKKLHKDDAQETDIKIVDPSAFTYALINAVREQQKTIERQDARIVRLERGHAPLLSSSVVSCGLEGMTLGLVPLGFIVGRRRSRLGRELRTPR